MLWAQVELLLECTQLLEVGAVHRQVFSSAYAIPYGDHPRGGRCKIGTTNEQCLRIYGTSKFPLCSNTSNAYIVNPARSIFIVEKSRLSHQCNSRGRVRGRGKMRLVNVNIQVGTRYNSITIIMGNFLCKFWSP